MNPLVAYIIARLSEPSTYRGIFALLTAIGLAIKPEQAAAITSAGLALIGVVNVFKKDAKSTALILGCLLLLPSCATNGAGKPTFLGLTGADWELVGKDAGIAALKSGGQAALISYSERKAAAIEVTATK